MKVKKALLVDGCISGSAFMERLISEVDSFEVKMAISGDKAIEISQQEVFDFVALELNFDSSVLQYDDLVKLLRQTQPNAVIFIYTSVKSGIVLGRSASYVQGVSLKTDDQRETKRLVKLAYEKPEGFNCSSAARKLLEHVELATSNSPLLTGPEHFVLKKIIQGYKDADIAEEMARSQKTVEKHKAALRKKFDVKTTAELAAKTILLCYDKLQIEYH